MNDAPRILAGLVASAYVSAIQVRDQWNRSFPHQPTILINVVDAYLERAKDVHDERGQLVWADALGWHAITAR
jgi:hypothetical protein